jgi:acetoin utilization deacetylase AcuC-like enzyme
MTILLLVCVLAVWTIPTKSLSHLPIYYDSSNKLHRDIQYHPEQAERIDVCVRAIRQHQQETGDLLLIRLVDVAETKSNNNNDYDIHEPFTQKELNHARDMLVKAHSEAFVSNLEQRCRDSRQRRIVEGKNPLGFIGYIDDDTFLTTESYDVCLRATAAWIRAVNVALNDSDGKCAMALTRPPGHHATSTLSNGFCIFNFAAAAALHALEQDSTLKVSILDWDVHYGQGVADIVKKHECIRYTSIHQTPAFPYEGQTRSLHGDYRNVLTIPILADNTWSCGYQDYYNNIALPFVQEDDSWEPNLVIVCAGYDALASDELASVSLTAPDYGRMTRLLQKHVQRSRRNKRPAGIVLGLEGGYQLAEGAPGGNLADAVVETVRALSDEIEDTSR